MRNSNKPKIAVPKEHRLKRIYYTRCRQVVREVEANWTQLATSEGGELRAVGQDPDRSSNSYQSIW